VRILVVDDDEAIRILLTSRLRSLGHELATAADGSQAWELLAQQPFDLVVCDWNMPAMNGLELCRRIRQSEWPSYLYVILCTAMNQKADFLAGMEAGADDFVVKPIDFADLRVRVRAADRILRLQSELSAQNKSLRELYDKLSTAYGTIERDLEAAAAMQVALLPKKKEIHPAVRLDWLLMPSLYLAGDMLNYFLVGENQLVFYQLDVAGHGIPAALLSVTLNRLLMPLPGSPILKSGSREPSVTLAEPRDVVSELNGRFQSADDTYFTMVYGILDTETRVVRFCQAGHPGPLVLSAGGELKKLGEGGFPVGMMPDMDYDQTSDKLVPGDKLILYSDGIPECLNESGRRYQELSLYAVLRRAARCAAGELVQEVRADILKWRGTTELSDDVSLLVMESLA
jgi:sigma-B regulation protein RsbU (phosphoserine phosphatase)